MSSAQQLITSIDAISTKVGEVADEVRALKPPPTDFVPRYQSLDEWSRHYSMARMTVVPFCITTCVAVLGWGWDRSETFASWGLPRWGLFPTLAMVLWLGTLALMVALTYRTYERGLEMRFTAARVGLSASPSFKRRIGFIKICDLQLWSISKDKEPVDNAHWEASKRRAARISWWLDPPWWAFLIASAGLWVVFCQHEVPAPSAPRHAAASQPAAASGAPAIFSWTVQFCGAASQPAK